METITYDGNGAILGRMASEIAKELLKGSTIEIINSEKVIVSGNKKNVIEKIQAKRKMGTGGSLKGPKYIRKEDRLLKRMIRGMIPRDRKKGQEAIKRLTCHIGEKKNPAADTPTTERTKTEIRTFKHQKPQKHTTLKEIVGGLR